LGKILTSSENGKLRYFRHEGEKMVEKFSPLFPWRHGKNRNYFDKQRMTMTPPFFISL
jgi:hypothetical protein